MGRSWSQTSSHWIPLIIVIQMWSSSYKIHLPKEIPLACQLYHYKHRNYLRVKGKGLFFLSLILISSLLTLFQYYSKWMPLKSLPLMIQNIQWIVTYRRIVLLMRIYPSCGSRTIPSGTSDFDDQRILLLLPWKSDIDIVPFVTSVQYSCNEFHSTARPQQAPVSFWMIVMFVPSIFERLMFWSPTSLQNM